MSYRKLGLRSNQRRALLRNMTTSFLKIGKITTTEKRAKEIRCIAEKMITLGKKGKKDLHAIRQVLAYLNSEDVVIKKIFGEYSTRFSTRNGGYTRIIKTGKYRKGDGSSLAILELVE